MYTLCNMVHIPYNSIRLHTLTYFIHSGTAPITNGMATVTVAGLKCGVTYTIIVGGTLDGQLVGPRSSHGTVTAGPCPPIITTTSVPTTSMTSKEKETKLI